MLKLEELTTREYNTEIRLFGPDGQPKPLWNENRLGRFLRRIGTELRLPFVTGQYGLVLTNHNLITTIGHAAANARITGQGSYAAFANIAIGTGAVAAAAGDTALGAEITTAGGGRGAATATQVTTTTTNDTAQLVKTFTFTGTFAVTEEGIFDSATASSGTLLARQVFSAVNVASGDSLQITHKVQS
jgi:hypothetical protein